MAGHVDHVVRDLVDAGFVAIEQVIGGALTATELSRRNETIRVSFSGVGVVVKRPGVADPGTDRTVAAERAFYAFASEHPALAAWVPTLVGIIGTTLVLELVPAHRPMHVVFDGAAPNVEVARALGAAMAATHNAPRPEGAWLLDKAPWIGMAHRPVPELLPGLSPGEARVLGIVQEQPELVQALEYVASSWAPSALIHGDIRSSNVLTDGVSVKLIDWELVQWGDPAWDLAGALQDLVSYWVSLVQVQPDDDPADILTRAPHPLSALHPAARSLTAACRLDWRHTVRLTAARLVQSAFENASAAKHGVTPDAVLMLQLAANLFAHPDRAGLTLFGVTPGAEALDAAVR